MSVIQSRTSNHLELLVPGTKIAGAYTVNDRVGIGSKSVVYLCRHDQLPYTDLALKILLPALSRDSSAMQRFEKEILACRGINHPNVIQSFEYVHDGSLCGYSMEYAGGGTLKRMMAEKDRFPLLQASSILCQICAGLEAVHQIGIVHRDIKPANIFFSASGTAKISDFGLALTSFGPRLTKAGEVLGTVGYASPEYLQTGAIDKRSDIYALGLIAYELVSGTFPFKGSSPIEAIHQRLTGDAPPLIAIVPDCPPLLSQIVARAMQRDPALRYQTAAQMLSDLDKIKRASAAPLTYASFADIPEAAAAPTLVIEAAEAVRQLQAGKTKFTPTRQWSSRKSLAVMLCIALLGLGFSFLAQKPIHKTAPSAQTRITALKALPPAAEMPKTPEATPKNSGSAAPKQTQENRKTVSKKLTPAKTTGASKTYQVKNGDTLGSISDRLKISMATLIKLNKIMDPNILQPGDQLLLPGHKAIPSENASESDHAPSAHGFDFTIEDLLK